MVVFGDRQNLSALIAAAGRVKTQAAFHYPPAIILTPRAVGWLKIDLFTRRLTNISDVKIVGQTIKGYPPGIAQPIRPDLFSDVRIAAGEKWIGGWDPIRGTGVDVQAQDLPEQNS